MEHSDFYTKILHRDIDLLNSIFTSWNSDIRVSINNEGNGLDVYEYDVDLPF